MSTTPLSASTLGRATRVLVGLFIVALGMTGAVLAIAATGGLRLDAWLIGTALLLAGFASLAITRVAVAPLRPTKIALTISIIIAGFLLLGLPWPPGPQERTQFVTLTLGIALSLGASFLGSRSSRSAFAMLAVLGGYGIFILARFGYTVGAGAAATAWSHPGPAMTISVVLAESLATAWIAACWHARSLWAARRTLRDRVA